MSKVEIYKPFFTRETAPDLFERSNVVFESIPIELIKNNSWRSKLLFDMIPHLPEGTYIAGGFLRAIIVNDENTSGDIDFFFNSSDAFGKMIDLLIGRNALNVFSKYTTGTELNYFRNESQYYRLINFNADLKYDNRPPIQLIKLIYFDSPEHVIDTFDFSIVQFATDGQRLYFNPQSFDDLRDKKLNLHKTQSSIITLNRVLKYEEKGYSADPEKFKEIADEAAKMLLNSGMEKLGQYFYISPDLNNTRNNSPEDDIQIPVSWLNHAWKYLAESENGRTIFAKLFGSKN